MKKRTTAIVGLAAAAAVTVGAGSAALAAGAGNTDPPAEQRAEAAYTDAHRSEAGITQADAERRALDAHPGRVVESHLESEGHGLRWEVKTTDGSGVREIQLDPSRGVVVSDRVESEGA